MTEFRNGKMTRLQDECNAIAERLKAQALSPEELVAREEKEREEERQRSLRKAWDFIREVGGARVYNVLKDKANLKETEAIKALRQLAQGGCAFIQSEPGAGKTVAGLQYAGRMIAQGFTVRYANAQELTHEHKGSGVLVIDEIGIEYVSPFWLTVFTRVLDYRYAQKLTTVLLTNLCLRDWAARYDTVEKGKELSGRIVSRIKQWAEEPGSVAREWCGENLRLKPQGGKDA